MPWRRRRQSSGRSISSEPMGFDTQKPQQHTSSTAGGIFEPHVGLEKGGGGFSTDASQHVSAYDLVSGEPDFIPMGQDHQASSAGSRSYAPNERRRDDMDSRRSAMIVTKAPGSQAEIPEITQVKTAMSNLTEALDGRKILDDGSTAFTIGLMKSPENRNRQGNLDAPTQTLILSNERASLFLQVSSSKQEKGASRLRLELSMSRCDLSYSLHTTLSNPADPHISPYLLFVFTPILTTHSFRNSSSTRHQHLSIIQ